MGWLKQKWQEFQQVEPGRRFQERYERNKELRQSKPWYRRFLKTALCFLIIGLGVVFLLIPGPGLPLVVIGAGMLADQSATVAKLLDRTELKIRRVLRSIQKWWKEASNPARGSAVGLAVICASAVGYLVYRVVAI